jgi:hypothetical protein
MVSEEQDGRAHTRRSIMSINLALCVSAAGWFSGCERQRRDRRDDNRTTATLRPTRPHLGRRESFIWAERVRRLLSGELGSDVGVVPDCQYVHKLKLVVSDAFSSSGEEISDRDWTGGRGRARRHQSCVRRIHGQQSIGIGIVDGRIPSSIEGGKADMTQTVSNVRL